MGCLFHKGPNVYAQAKHAFRNPVEERDFMRAFYGAARSMPTPDGRDECRKHLKTMMGKAGFSDEEQTEALERIMSMSVRACLRVSACECM